jgi:hypothetical protein
MAVYGPDDPDVERMGEWLGKTTLEPGAREDLIRLHTEGVRSDYLAGLSDREKKERLARISYEQFLDDALGVHEHTKAWFDDRPKGLFCVGIDAYPALFAWAEGYPGFQLQDLQQGIPTPVDRTCSETYCPQFGHCPRYCGETNPPTTARFTLLVILIPSCCPLALSFDLLRLSATLPSTATSGLDLKSGGLSTTRGFSFDPSSVPSSDPSLSVESYSPAPTASVRSPGQW